MTRAGKPQALRMEANELDHRAGYVTGDAERLRDRADELNEPQCGTCGWRHTPVGRCPSPACQLCGSCDAGLPMTCTCVDQPAVTA